ncbi:hypothetical protein C8J56DRAFT_1050362 [Mycena floridula]|nr:hypothetical protein C8J56DRAFT_1050362 [Mycena floridula]
MLQDSIGIQERLISMIILRCLDDAPPMQPIPKPCSVAAELNDALPFASRLWDIPKGTAPFAESPSFSSCGQAILGISRRRKITIGGSAVAEEIYKAFPTADAAPFK